MWKSRQYHEGGGGDANILKDIRIYSYTFKNRWTDSFLRNRISITIPFEIDKPFVNSTLRDHQKILEAMPFYINGEQIMLWIKENITSGSAKFNFYVDNSLEYMSPPYTRRENLYLEAAFSDPKMAMLFKLCFGGK